MTEPNKTRCDGCGKPNPAGAGFCGYCGKDLHARTQGPEKKTMFGYAADLDQLRKAAAEAKAATRDQTAPAGDRAKSVVPKPGPTKPPAAKPSPAPSGGSSPAPPVAKSAEPQSTPAPATPSPSQTMPAGSKSPAKPSASQTMPAGSGAKSGGPPSAPNAGSPVPRTTARGKPPGPLSALRTGPANRSGGLPKAGAIPAPTAAAPAAAPSSPRAPAAAVPGSGATVVGRYELGEPVGELAVGKIYAATDSSDAASVHVLVVPPEVFPSPLDAERTRRELRQLQRVDAAEIVKILDQGKHEAGWLYVVMEATGGRPLDQVIADGPMDLDTCKQVIKSVGSGLAEAQKVGVIHRDIAPHNVLIESDGSVKLRGFGMAAAVKNRVQGTPAFLSPEQAAGRPVDQRSNIYSLGALMFYMLTGQPPFSGDVDELLEKHQKAEPPSPKDVHPGLELPARGDQLIAKALAKSSSRRHLTLRQFMRDVDAVGTKIETPLPPKQPKALSFETPLHGVTALTDGRRPPSSEYAPVTRQPVVSPTVPAGAPPTPASQPASAGGEPAVGLAATELSKAPSPAPDEPQSQAVSASGGAAFAGEMSGGERVRLKRTGEMEKVSDPGPQTDEPSKEPAAQGQQRKGFRETMWFFKGEIESQMAEEGGEAPPDPDVPGDLADKYADDGSLNDDEARRLSLRTGHTQAMRAVNVPSGEVPGKRMKPEEFIDQINRGRRMAMIIGLILLIGGGVAAALVFLL